MCSFSIPMYEPLEVTNCKTKRTHKNTEKLKHACIILLALLKFVCGHSEVIETKDLLTMYRDHREGMIKAYKKTIKGFKGHGFRTPTSAMPGMAEEEMLGSRPNKLKISLPKYKQLRTRIMNLSSQECQDSIKFLEIQLKNKLYA